MKNLFLLVSLLLIAFGLKSQELAPASINKSNAIEPNITQNSAKEYGDIIWEEDFNKEKWFSTVKVDGQGYLLDTTASLPVGWTFIDSTNNSYYWHWSDVGPRGVYTGTDAFTPNNGLLDSLPDGTSLDNGFMLLESDYFNTADDGEMVENLVEMNSYFEFGPIDFGDYNAVIFNCKILDRLCCNVNNLVGLYISSDYNPTTNTGNWEVYKLNTHTNAQFTIDKDMHIDVSEAAAGHDNVYFKIGKRLATNFFVIIDDIKFYDSFTDNSEIAYNINNALFYPNPFSGSLNVSNLVNAKQILVSNMLGQILMSIPITKNEININTNNLDKGIYLISIIDCNNSTITKRVVKY